MGWREPWRLKHQPGLVGIEQQQGQVLAGAWVKQLALAPVLAPSVEAVALRAGVRHSVWADGGTAAAELLAASHRGNGVPVMVGEGIRL